MALIKNYDQSVYSGYKTRESLVVASIKNINGLDATSGVDPDAQNYFDQIALVGSTIGAPARTAINTFCVNSKAHNTWDGMLDIGPVCGDDLAAALVKLKKLSSGWSYTNLGGTPLNDGNYAQITGVTFNNVAYLGTGVNGTDLTANSSGICVYDRSDSASTRSEHGAADGSSFIYCAFPYSDAKLYSDHYNITSEAASSAITGSVGFVHAVRASSSDHSIYHNGSQVAFSSASAGTRPSNEIYFAACNGAIVTCAHSFSFFALTAGMDSTQAADFYADVQALQTALARQV